MLLLLLSDNLCLHLLTQTTDGAAHSHGGSSAASVHATAAETAAAAETGATGNRQGTQAYSAARHKQQTERTACQLNTPYLYGT